MVASSGVSAPLCLRPPLPSAPSQSPLPSCRLPYPLSRVTIQESLLSFLYQQSTTSQIFPTYYEAIGQDWKVISIKVYLISSINNIIYHRLKITVFRLRYSTRNDSQINTYRCKFLVDTGTIIKINNKLNNKWQEEVQGRLVGKQVSSDSSNSVR